MYTQPYDTSVLRNYPTKATHEQLEVGFIKGELAPVEVHSRDGEEALQALYEILPGNESVQILEAPMLLETREGLKVIIDSRSTKSVGRDEPSRVIAPSDYKFAVREAILTYLWASEGTIAFSQLGVLPIRVYARWISESLVRRLGLDPSDALRVSVLAAYFYLCSHASEPLTDGQQIGVSTLIARAIGLPAEHVLPVVQEAGFIGSLKELVEKMKRAAGISPRLEAVNAALLYTLLNSSWFGARKSLIVATALEYPPTFLTMLLTAITDRSYHASYFAKTVKDADKGHLSRDFVLAINHLSRGFTDG